MADLNRPTQEFTVAPDLLQRALDVDFTKRLEDTFTDEHPVVGSVVKGVVVAMDSEAVTVDIGLKTEGIIPLKEFEDFETSAISVKVGDVIEVFVDNLDDRKAHARLSREKARREEMLTSLEGSHKDNKPVKGVIFGKVKGGFMVDVQGVLGFLPGSQLDAKPVVDANPFMYIPLEFQVVKIDRKRNNLIVSRRAMTDGEGGTMGAGREELLATMREGAVVKGTVKNITDYGAFIDLGGLDGLLHITDIAWHRIGHPSEVLTVGQQLDVMVVRYDERTQRVSLGIKQLRDDPWTTVEKNFPIGARIAGKITNMTDYGAFVQLAPGVEGLIHVSEMSWTRKNIHPSKVVTTGQQVDVMVLEIDRDKRRISLGLKQTQENPWDAFTKSHKVGDHVEGSVRSLTDFGVFVALTDEIDGLVHVSDLSWEQAGEEALQAYKKGDTVKAIILQIDPAKERIALGVKQLSEDPTGGAGSPESSGPKKGDTLEVEVTGSDAEGLTVAFNEQTATIKSRDLGLERADQDASKFKVGQKIQAKVISFSKKEIKLSVRALQQDEERDAVANFSNADSSSGDSALASALKQAQSSSKSVADAAAAASEAAAEPKTEKAPAKKATAKKAEPDEADAKPAKKAPAKKKADA